MSAPSSHYQLIEQEYSALFQEFKGFAPHAGVVFKVLGVLGEGGMGKVLKVNDERLGRLAALKLLLNNKQSEKSKELFLRESQIMSWLDHPSIPPVYEWGCTAEGEHYLLMRLVDGATLTEKIEQCHNGGKVSKEAQRTLLENLVKVTEAVAYAHSMGFLHRDLKPDNIMVGPFGEVLVMDWGLAKDMQGRIKNIEGQLLEAKKEGKLSFGLSEKSGMVGTIGYMSPEQANSEKTDPLTDVFALGVILTKLLTNKDAIHGENGRQMLFATVAGRIKGPRQLLSRVPRELDSLAVKAMALRKEDRIQSAEQFGKELKAYLAGEKLSVHNYSLSEKLGRWIRNHVTLAFVALLFILLISLSGFLRAWIEQSKVDARRRLALAEEKTRAKALALEQEKKDLVVAEQEKGFAERAASRAKRVLDLFNQARELGRRELKKQEVQDLVEEAIELAGRNETALMTGADVYDNAGLMEPLKRVLKETIEKHPPALAALYYLHWIEVRDKTFEERNVTIYLRLLIAEAQKYSLKNEFTMLADATNLFNEGRSKEAIEVYNEIERINSSLWDVYNNRGKLRMALGDYKGALEDFAVVIEKSPGYSSGYADRAFCFIGLRRFQEAGEDIEKARQLDENNPEVYYKRAQLSRIQGRFSDALGDISKAIDLGESHKKRLAYYHCERSLIYRCENKFDLALKSIVKALRLKPSDPMLYLEQASVYSGLEEVDKALKSFEQAKKINPRNGALYYIRGKFYEKFNRLDEALADYNKAIQLRSNYGEAFHDRGNLRFILGDYQLALQDLDRAIKLNVILPVSYQLRALSLFCLNQFQAALIDINKCLELNRDFYSAYFVRGKIQYSLGSKEKSRIDFKTFIDKLPKHSRAPEARQYVERIDRELKGS